MDYFQYRDSVAYCEDVPLTDMAERYGTPLYLYSGATLARHCQNFLAAFSDDPTIACYAVKANSNLGLLRRIFAAGFGADVVSIGELERSVLAGVDPRKVVFSGVGKRPDEIVRALALNILAFNVESAFELEKLAAIAGERNQKASVCLRINPDIDADTNPKITTGLHSSKFGISEDVAWELMRQYRGHKHLRMAGLSCHIGSQIVSLGPLEEAARRMVALAKRAMSELRLPLELLNMGGGLGIRYASEAPPELADYAGVLTSHVRETGLRLIVEPGRVLVGNCGVLLTRVLGIKQSPSKTFVVVDAAMNDLVRPALYESYHEICAVNADSGASETHPVDIVGPICETGDVLGHGRVLPPVRAGDLLFIRSAGAYAASMASQYNSRPRAAEVLVQGADSVCLRRRETLQDLWALELGGDDAQRDQDTGKG